MGKTSKQKKPIHKRWWFWVLVFYVVLMLIGGIFGGNDSDSPDRSLPEAVEETEAPTATPKPTPRPTAKPTDVPDPTDTPVPTPEPEHDYIININTGVFHDPSCPSVSRMSEKNKQYYTGTRSSVIGMGYDPCDNCNP